MGVLTDLLVADRSEAATMATSVAPLETCTGIDAKGIDQVKLGTLNSILAGEPYRDEFVDQFITLHEESEDGPWVFLVPPPLVSLLAAQQDADLSRITREWSETEEFQLDAWTTAEVGAVLGQLCAVARRARDERKDLLMWMCL